MNTFKTLKFTFTLAFVLAGMLATTAHEVSHFVRSLLLEEKPTLFPPIVKLSDSVSSSHLTLIAATGPFFSLISGLLIIYLNRNWGRGFMRLFWLWLGFLSAQIGFGYFFASVISRSGDTGLALTLLHALAYVFALVFIIGGLSSWFFCLTSMPNA